MRHQRLDGGGGQIYLLDEGVYVIGFFFPVIPQGQARFRVQTSGAQERADLDRTLDAFEKVGRKLEMLRSKG